jgi:Fe-S oxidoreductase
LIPPPSAGDLRRAAELCEFCPKMCRFACPVSEATAREALTPWGKSSLAALTAARSRAPDASAALAFHGCTGCLRCTHYCTHANDVPTMLYAARAVAVRSGAGPVELRDLPTRMSERGCAQPGDLAKTLSALRADDEVDEAAERAKHPPASASLLGPLPILMPGCDALAAGGSVARDALRAARRLHAPLRAAPDGVLCCGLPLLQAGHPDAFAEHALKVRDSLAPPGDGAEKRGQPVHLVFLSAPCARSVRDRYPGFGAPLPAGSIVEHVTTYLARALALRPEARARPKLPGPVAYHDPCELARGLGEVQAPRALLAACVEGGAREATRSGADASCCGAGGLLPATMPKAAEAIAADRKRELAATGAPAVTSSPACAAALSAENVVSLVARWLSQT